MKKVSLRSVPYYAFDVLPEKSQFVVETCNALLSQLEIEVTDERERQREELAEKLKARVYDYSIKVIKDGWIILYKKVRDEHFIEGRDDNEAWSRPFKVINNVLFHAEFCHKGMSWLNANALIPQGLFDMSTLESINKNW